MGNDSYHQSVADYYDDEASTFESRADSNPVLIELRKQFREVVLNGNIESILEIGYGPGLDMVWFSEQEKNVVVHGLDITPSFHKIVLEKSEMNQKLNPLLGGPTEAVEYFEPSSIDTVYVFFGALNTCGDLDLAVEQLSQILKPGGRIVATFVNKWYLFEIFWNLLTFRPSRAFARLRRVWGGYSPTRHLASTCYSARQINRIFGKYMKKSQVKGYCITHPAWYRQHWAPIGGIRSRILFNIDQFLQWTPFWNCGEYSLYVYEKPV